MLLPFANAPGAGPSGPQGACGVSGVAGACGVSGVAGVNGACGVSGVAGACGVSGTTGSAGACGVSGVAGACGVSGVTGDIYLTTSTTSNSISIPTTSLTFTVAAGLAYTPVQSINIVYNSTNYMTALVTSYSGTTLICTVSTSIGSGTYTAWTINLDGATGGQGACGVSGVAGACGVSGVAGACGVSGVSGVAGACGVSGVAGACGVSGVSGVGVTGAASATVATSQTTTSSTATDLATAGPSVTVTIQATGLALVSLACGYYNSGTDYSVVYLVVSGANTIAAKQYMIEQGTNQQQNSATFLLTGLSTGSTTFKMQYSNANNASTATFFSRIISVIPL